MNDTITSKLKEEISNKLPNELFTIKDFINIGSYDTIKRLLIRLENDGEIIRVIDGIYTIPKYSKLTNEVVDITHHNLALKIADNFSWKIVPTGLHALNILGISLQVPITYEYLSTGPYRSYFYNDKEIKFKNTRSSDINNLSYTSALVISSIRTLGKNNINEKIISKLKETLTSKEKETLIEETIKTTSWIYEVIKEVANND